VVVHAPEEDKVVVHCPEEEVVVVHGPEEEVVEGPVDDKVVVVDGPEEEVVDGPEEEVEGNPVEAVVKITLTWFLCVCHQVIPAILAIVTPWLSTRSTLFPTIAVMV